jgi:putative intracellular protease/amidase
MITVGTVLFEGFELLDVFGPLEMYGMLGDRVELLLISERIGNVRSHQGSVVVSEHEFGGIDSLDVLLVPGGMGTRHEVTNPALINGLVALAAKARFVTSVCTGSALLARAGLLDGKKATSNKRAFAWVKKQGPNVEWIAEARWVEDGNVFTSSGVSAGMDMTLGVIERLFDRQTSVEVADQTEYEWHEDKNWDPFAKKNGLI